MRESRVRSAYDRLSTRYDARWEAYVAATARETLARVELPEAGILDVGCGTGVLLEEVSGISPGIGLVGVDLSAGMLRRARERLPRRVHLVEGSVRRLPFASGSFELVISVSALHFWRRPLEGLLEIRRVLRPGGRLVLTDWCREGWIMSFRDARLRLTDRAHFRTWSAAELAGLLRDAGFRTEGLDRYRVPGRWTMMTASASVREASRRPE